MNAITRSLSHCWQSSVGKKLLVAVTGVFLALFLAGHLAGNLLVFAGAAAFNDYAEFLHHMLHGAGIWAFRAVMLAAVVVHVAATISLTRSNRAAREPYQCQATIQATRSSLTMIWSGLTVLAFLVYHLLHFTIRAGNQYDTLDRYKETLVRDGGEVVRHNAWQMVVDGFSVWYVSLFYVVAMCLLAAHLAHGVQSAFQTLGLRSAKTAAALDLAARGYAAAIWLGFVSIPVAINVFGFGR
jgi:succinate dehydrogenase / fumarate reductase, cytochrome b subunit